ncbi:MAG: sugar transferase [Clostridia bacterium]|nr:sugar transferase [Clostridia bacterium]
MNRHSFYERFVKRCFDVLLCGLALIVLSPVFLLTALAIKLSSPGPVFYYSMRLGKDKVPFRFYKFRSMHPPKGNDKGLCIADADRAFPVGRVIRRLKIDELPQLINVIQGRMSIVGPRPMAANSVDNFYSGRYEVVSSIRPGLTSAASLYDYTVGDTYSDEKAYRENVVPVKLEMELLYVKKQSFPYDVSLVWRTIVTIVLVLFHSKNLPVQPELKEISVKRHDK